MMLFNRLGRIDLPDGGYNPSICRHKGRLLCAFRVDWMWRGKPDTHTYIAEMTSDLGTLWSTQLAGPAEDPRPFTVGEHLYCSHATSPAWGDNRVAEQVLQSLGDNFLVQKSVLIPYGEGAQRNWLFFGYRGRVYAVQRVKPHVVLRIGLGGKIKAEYKTEWTFSRDWRFSRQHGSTPPVRIGDRYYAFFHGWFRKQTFPDGTTLPRLERFYYNGAYTFEAKPPFRVLQVTPEPVWSSSGEDRRILFPAGAIYADDRFYISQGVNDKWGELIAFTKAEIDERLVQV